MTAPVTTVRMSRFVDGGASAHDDLLVVEEPLEIRLGHGPLDDRREFRLSVTMRTPGHDQELAFGFLLTEGIIAKTTEVVRVLHCEDVKEGERGNVVRAELHPLVEVDPSRWQRNFYVSSSCGVCGKSSIEAVHVRCVPPASPPPRVDPAIVLGLPGAMRSAQTVFKHTGGIHAAALFDREGRLLVLREDVGRHNAVDKVVGAMHQQAIAAEDHILLVSGRAGFELVQKCAVAGIRAMAAVGAPSSLAVSLAREQGITLIGFLRDGRFNSYSGPVDHP